MGVAKGDKYEVKNKDKTSPMGWLMYDTCIYFMISCWIMRIKWRWTNRLESEKSSEVLRHQTLCWGRNVQNFYFYQTCFFLASWGVTGVLQMFPFLLFAFSTFHRRKKHESLQRWQVSTPCEFLRVEGETEKFSELLGISKLFRGFGFDFFQVYWNDHRTIGSIFMFIYIYHERKKNVK